MEHEDLYFLGKSSKSSGGRWVTHFQGCSFRIAGLILVGMLVHCLGEPPSCEFLQMVTYWQFSAESSKGNQCICSHGLIRNRSRAFRLRGEAANSLARLATPCA
jgi:hypothetical protein